MFSTCKRCSEPFHKPTWPPRPSKPFCPLPPLPPLPKPGSCCEPCCEPSPRFCPPRGPAPRVQCCGRVSRRSVPATICVTGLPCGVCGPWTLLALEPTCEEPCVRIKHNCRGPSPTVAEVVVPLIAWVCDANGCRHAGCAEAVICVSIARACACAHGAFMATADVRLQDAGCPVCGPTFEVRLRVCAEVFVVWMDSCGRRAECDCFFDNRPFYPQPCRC
ncbi:MAG: hypothetical protein FWF69_01660 [Firmicutes bacterium]|nr:hypothetical protein [Bacillota bacterium]